MSTENQITAMLMLKVPGKDQWQGMGRKEFRVLPRTGELIEYDIDGIGYMCKVVAVAHPSEPTFNIGDIYAVQLGQTTDVLKQIFDHTQVPQESSAAWWGFSTAELPESSGGLVWGSIKR